MVLWCPSYLAVDLKPSFTLHHFSHGISSQTCGDKPAVDLCVHVQRGRWRWWLPTLFRSTSRFRVFSNELAVCIRWPVSAWGKASASIFPMNMQGWFPLELTGLIPLQSRGLAEVFSSTTVWKHQLFSARYPLWSNSQVCTYYRENHSFDCAPLVMAGKVMSLLLYLRSVFFK